MGVGKLTYPMGELVCLCASMLESVCAAFVGNCLCILCFVVLRLIKMENISSIPKKRSLECILGMLKSEEQ